MRRFHALFERSMAEGPDLSQSEREILEGEALLRMSFLSFNDISGMSAFHRRIRALAPVARNPWTQGSPSVAMLYHSTAGALDRENEEMRDCIPVYCAVSGGHGSGSIQVMQGETDLLRGRFAEADVCRHQAEEAARSGGDPSLRTAAVFLAARLAPYLDPPQDGLALPDRLVLPFAEIDLGERLTALLPDGLREEIATLRGTPSSDETAALTPREREIAVLAAQRRSTAEIADALHLSAGTVKNRLSVVYEKLGLGPEVRGKRAALARLLGEEPPKL